MTNTIKHTPGPWHACNDGECPCRQVRSTAPERGDCGFYVAHVVAHPDCGEQDFEEVYVSVDEAKANARLIAAAPQMLEALEGIIDSLFEVHIIDNSLDNQAIRYALTVASQAIAAARGEGSQA